MTDRLIRIFKSILPAPFTIAVILTLVTLILAYFISPNKQTPLSLLNYWEKGLWNPPLLVGAFYCFGDLLVNMTVVRFEDKAPVGVTE